MAVQENIKPLDSLAHLVSYYDALLDLARDHLGDDDSVCLLLSVLNQQLHGCVDVADSLDLLT